MKHEGSTIAAIMLTAGRGERMMPLTAQQPKALLPILDAPLFEILVEKLLRQGASEIHCNLFHLPGQIETFADGRGWPVIFHRERELLGTGGGIGNMADGVSHADAILLHNGDILSDISYEDALALHRQRDALATLVLLPSGPPANVALAEGGEILNISADEGALAGAAQILGYAGLAVLSPRSLAFFPRGKRAGLVDILLEMARKKPGSVIGWNAASRGARCAWGEAGSPSGYLDIHRNILVEKVRFDPALEPPPLPLYVGEHATVEPGVTWKGFCAIGRRALVGRDARLENCVIMSGTIVPSGAIHENEILFPGGALKAAGNA